MCKVVLRGTFKAMSARMKKIDLNNLTLCCEKLERAKLAEQRKNKDQREK